MGSGSSGTPPDALGLDVLEALLEGCQVIDRGYRYLYLNPAALDHARRPASELLGRTMMECYPGIEQTEMFAVLRRCLEERVYGRLENEFTYPDGARGWFDLRFVPVPSGLCVLSVDVTALKRASADLVRAEQQLRHAQKMEAVGRLAGGIAHDFNNLLSVVLSHAELLLLDLAPTDPIRSDLEEIRKAGARASEVTRQLLAFSRRQVLQPAVLDLNQVVRSLEPMLRRLLGADVAVSLLLAPQLGRVRADVGQLEQVIMNLVVNARDAMPAGGKLVLETRDVHLDEEYARLHHEVIPGPHVLLAVTDDGEGMDRETLSRIFEPFFTTKAAGKGTGLGLAMVFGIVKQSGGHVWVYSEPGRGATFKIYLPRAEGAITTTPTPTTPRDDAPASETILLVEDDDQVRGVALAILRRAGYRVLEAPNAGEALLLAEQHPATIHLLVTDVVLPRMSGRALAERLVSLRPRMKVLFMSGYTDEAILQHGILESSADYLQKPITPERLRRRVREVLARATAGGDGPATPPASR